MNLKIIVPAGVLTIVERLRNAGHKAYVVGGAVRDALIGKDIPCDWDVATSASPEEVIELFSRTYPTGIKHGTVTVIEDNLKVEVTTFRKETRYLDGRHPDNISFVVDIEEDLSRRDFTFNAIAYNPLTEELIDPFGGIKDLKRGVVRAIGDPEERIVEDRLRMMRALRFAGLLKFRIDKKTFLAIKKNSGRILSVSVERIRDEFFKMLLIETPSFSLEYMRESGLMREIIPELLEGYEVAQNKHHAYSVYVHLLKVCDNVPPKLNLRLAGLFHDIGKSRTKKGPHFYGHEIVGAEMTKDILKRLRAPNELIKNVTHLVRHHMVNYSDKWGDGAVRRFIRRVGVDNLPDIFELLKADTSGKGTGIGDWPIPLVARVDRVLDNGEALSIKDLKINGADIIDLLKIPPGPKVGEILKDLLEMVIEEPYLNTSERLSKIVMERFR